MADNSPNPVLILGAGINGAAIARELALSAVPVCLVDRQDIASGATAYSSRLIHGGLRYLEYGEFDLVRESLVERQRLLRLAPHLVRPLRLAIPVECRFSGLFPAAAKFFGFKTRSTATRGQWLVRLGLTLYDWFSRGDGLPRHHTRAINSNAIPAVDPNRFRWLCDYWDAQVVYPERFTLALLEDARCAAQDRAVSFDLLTRHTVRLVNGQIEIVANDGDVVRTLAPRAIINATGAWVDRALATLPVTSPPLMGPTKGSHLVTSHAALRSALGDDGVYTESADGRAIFILPFGGQTLIGTTDLPFDEPPENAIATDDEIDYLIAVVRRVFPQIELSRGDIDLHYSGVRPLPRVSAATPGGITRRHWLHEHADAPLPLYSVIGGKLTTCRSLAESVADTLLAKLGQPRLAATRERPIPGGENYPTDAAGLERHQHDLATQTGWPLSTIQVVWKLYGTRTINVLTTCAAADRQLLDNTSLPIGLATHAIRHEWARTISDLVERRLMLLYHAPLTRACLRQLAAALVAENHLSPESVEQEIDAAIHRLKTHYGKHVVD